MIRNPRNVDECTTNFRYALASAGIDIDFAQQLVKGIGFLQIVEAVKNNNKIRKPSSNTLPYS
jgi:hypothetical protein